eukprot:scaffold40942_cov68-Phaeocystis_antarctica.AAC.3
MRWDNVASEGRGYVVHVCRTGRSVGEGGARTVLTGLIMISAVIEQVYWSGTATSLAFDGPTAPLLPPSPTPLPPSTIARSNAMASASAAVATATAATAVAAATAATSRALNAAAARAVCAAALELRTSAAASTASSLAASSAASRLASHSASCCTHCRGLSHGGRAGAAATAARPAFFFVDFFERVLTEVHETSSDPSPSLYPATSSAGRPRSSRLDSSTTSSITSSIAAFSIAASSRATFSVRVQLKATKAIAPNTAQITAQITTHGHVGKRRHVASHKARTWPYKRPDAQKTSARAMRPLRSTSSRVLALARRRACMRRPSIVSGSWRRLCFDVGLLPDEPTNRGISADTAT